MSEQDQANNDDKSEDISERILRQALSRDDEVASSELCKYARANAAIIGSFYRELGFYSVDNPDHLLELTRLYAIKLFFSDKIQVDIDA